MTSSSQYEGDHNIPQHSFKSSAASLSLIDSTNEPMQNYDGSQMRDANSQIVYKSQFLSTHPLVSDCKERVGYGGNKFTYVSGDGVIRTMNAIFGHGGWSSQILNEKLIQSEKDDRGRWYVGYLATVRVKLLNGASHEDCGSGEGINESKIKAHEKALKSAVTDAMKRAARHFGERLGNALYIKGNGIRTAPRTNRDALVELERRDATNLFGDQVALRGKSNDDQSSTEDENKFVAAAIAAATNNEAIRTAASATLTSAAAGAATSGNLSFVHQKSNNNNNNANRSIVNSLLCPKPPQNPSPIISRGTLVQQHPQLISVPGNHLLSIHPQQQFVQHQTMAPPPNRSMYNPSNNTGKTTCHISNYSQQQQVATNVSTDTMKRALDEGDESNIVKRQKLNPYCTNKQRLTV